MAKLETITNEGALLFSRLPNTNTTFEFLGCKCFSNPNFASSVEEAKALKASDYEELTPSLGVADYIKPIEVLPIEATNPTHEMSINSNVEDVAIELNFAFQGSDELSPFNQICLYGCAAHFCVEWNPLNNYVSDDAVISVGIGGVKTYYRCISAISGDAQNLSPADDPTHWTSFAIDGPNDYDATYDEKNGLVRYNVDKDKLIYVLQFSQSIQAISGVFIDWKIRLFLNSSIVSKIYAEGVQMDADTLAQNGAIQLEFIKELSEEMRVTRDLQRTRLGI